MYHPVKTPVDILRRAVAAQERDHGWAATRWYPTSGDDAGSAAAEKAVRDDPSVVMVAGGDGTVRVVAEAV